MTLKAHEDKTFPGAMIASMSIPWGFAVNADAPGVGGYHLVWARDLYEIATAMLIAGDRPAAERALNYLFTVQQKPDGSFPQNSWLDGKPYWTALQIDEVSYPLILAWQLDKTDADTWSKHVKPAADFVVAHGPATQEERRGGEEVPGLLTRSTDGRRNRRPRSARGADIARKKMARQMTPRYTPRRRTIGLRISKLGLRDHHRPRGRQRSATGGYYIRINNNTDPNDGFQARREKRRRQLRRTRT